MPFGFAASRSCCTATYGIGWTMLIAGGPNSSSGARTRLALVDGSGVADDDADDRVAAHRLGHEVGGRRGDEGDAAAHLVGGVLHEVAPEPHDLARHRRRVHEHPAEHDRSDRVQLKGELGDDAEVAAAAAQRPEQVGVLVG